jgi:putative sigma-54 modulation protein
VKTTLHARHLDLDERLKARIERKLQRLDRIADASARATVELDAKASRDADASHVAAITLVSRGSTMHSSAAAGTPMAAVDAVVDKLERQLVRAKQLVREGRRSAGRASADDGQPAVEAGEPPEVVEITRLDMVPMFPEDAITRMDELGQAFFVFLNAQTKRVSVVYRRSDGGHGLIDPVLRQR